MINSEYQLENSFAPHESSVRARSPRPDLITLIPY